MLDSKSHAIIYDLSKYDDVNVKEVKETLLKFSFTSLENQTSVFKETFDRLNYGYVPINGGHRLMNEKERKQLQCQVHQDFNEIGGEIWLRISLIVYYLGR